MNVADTLKRRLLGIIGLLLILISPWLPWYTLTTKYITVNFTMLMEKTLTITNNGVTGKITSSGFVFAALNILLCFATILDLMKGKYRSEIILGIVAVAFSVMGIYDLKSYNDYFSAEYMLYGEAYRNAEVYLNFGLFLHLAGAIALFVDYSMVKKGRGLIETKPESKKNDNLDVLLKYKQLLDAGAITQEEYEAKKKELLG